MIIEFKGRNSISKDDRRAIAEIIRQAFWGKMGSYFKRTGVDESLDVLEEAITFDKGFYYKEDGQILAAALLATTDIPYMRFFPKQSIKLGLWNALILQIGFATARPKQSDGLKLEMLAVSPEARGKGVGSAMLYHLDQLAANEKHDKTTLEVIDTNGKAKKLYEKMGYVSLKFTNTALFTSRMGFRGSYKMQKSHQAAD